MVRGKQHTITIYRPDGSSFYVYETKVTRLTALNSSAIGCTAWRTPVHDSRLDELKAVANASRANCSYQNNDTDIYLHIDAQWNDVAGEVQWGDGTSMNTSQLGNVGGDPNSTDRFPQFIYEIPLNSRGVLSRTVQCGSTMRSLRR